MHGRAFSRMQDPQQRDGRMLPRVCARLCLVVLSLFIAACHEPPTAPRSTPVEQTRPRHLVAFGDDCFEYAWLSCNDGTTAGGIIEGSAYGSLGGFDPCYSGAPGSCGSGLGTWDDASPSCSYSQPCLVVNASISSGWIGCPGQIAFNGYNVTTQVSELWVLTKSSNYTKLGVLMGSYVGTYSSGGVTTTAVSAKMVCGAGFVASVATFP